MDFMSHIGAEFIFAHPQHRLELAILISTGPLALVATRSPDRRGRSGVQQASRLTGPRQTSRFVVAVLGFAFIYGPARAQLLDQYIPPDISGLSTEPSVTVLSRARPLYDSLGTRIGNFTIRPELNESLGYATNATATAKPHGSAVVETNAGVQAVYDHSGASGAAELSVDDVRYPSARAQSFTNWTASIGGSYEVGRDLLIASFEHLNLTQTVQDLDVPQLDQALAYEVNTVRLGYRFVLNRIFIQPNLTVSDFSYENGTARGVTYLQNYRDRTVYTPAVTVGYQLFPQASAIVVLRDAIGQYGQTSSSPFRRDFNDVSVLGGIDYNPAGLVRYRVLAGYEVRSFVSAAYKSISSPVVEASVIWTPSGLTTVTGTAARSVQDSASEVTSGLTEMRLGLRVDHELRRNVLLRASFGFATDEYTGTSSSQSLFTAGAGATYLMNRNMRLTASYDFVKRRSSSGAGPGLYGGQPTGQSYSDNRFLLRLRMAL